MALMGILHHLTETLEISLVIAHINHGLRPGEAEYEEALVRKQTQFVGLVYESSRVDAEAKSSREGMSIEQAARELRYAFYESVAAKHGAEKIAVAHTADDQAEEVLLRLIRGTGRKGLSGMCRIRDGKVVRPLLAIAKIALFDYLHDRKIPFLEDSSNQERIYLRNKVRLDLLPLLAEEFNPNIKQVLRQTASILHDEEELLDKMTDSVFADSVTLTTEANKPEMRIDLALFTPKSMAIKRRVLEKGLWKLGAKPGFRQINSLIKLADGHGPGSMHLAQGLRVVRNDGVLEFLYPEGKAGRRGDLARIDCLSFKLVVPEPGIYILDEIGLKVDFEILSKIPDKKAQARKDFEYFDFSTLSFPLMLRNRKPGDKFHPLGSSGRKKVGEFFGDMKMPLDQRAKVPLLVCNQKIVALLGVRIDHAHRITCFTQKVLQVSLTPL